MLRDCRSCYLQKVRITKVSNLYTWKQQNSSRERFATTFYFLDLTSSFCQSLLGHMFWTKLRYFGGSLKRILKYSWSKHKTQSPWHWSCYVFMQVMFLVIDLEDEEFSKPMLSVYGLDTCKPVVSNFSEFVAPPGIFLNNHGSFNLGFYCSFSYLISLYLLIYTGCWSQQWGWFKVPFGVRSHWWEFEGNGREFRTTHIGLCKLPFFFNRYRLCANESYVKGLC